MASPDPNTSSARSWRLLIVDDDPDIAALIVRYFGTHGFGVVAAADGNEMRRVLAAQPIDVVLLDLGLPGEDGLELTRYLREHWHGAVIIVTGRGESVDRVVGLELGADDYVTKPFDLRELLARIRSVLRRIAERSTPPKAPKVAPVFRFGEFRLDPATRELRNARGELIVLTTGEYDLLIVLLEHPNRVLSRDDLMTWLHGRDMGPYDRAIDVQIGRLRRKIEVDAANALIIKSVRGAGYLFATPVQRE
jgi:two-component system, OmpR family, response regulator